MNKVSGLRSDFSYMKEEGTRIIIGYGLEKANDDLWSWYEVYLPKKQTSQLTLQIVKDAILGDIDAHTDERILTEYTWRVPKVGGEPEDVSVWLSSENQFNYKAAFDLAVQTEGASLPVVFKFGTTENPVYHTFEQLSELKDFYVGAIAFINNTLNDGWQFKDSIDWTPYEELFPVPEPPQE